jgi:cation-transporting P-type ATPase F
MATLHDGGSSDGARTVFVKGAVEKVLERTTTALGADGAETTLDADAVRARVDELARQGLRVLAFARGRFEAGRDEVHHRDLEGFTFLGLQAMIDPPRPEAMAAVAACKQAGIAVKMITGDHAATAAAIARQIGIIGADEADRGGLERDQEGRSRTVGGHRRRDGGLRDGELIELAETTNVFARVTPEQKLRLVEALQSRGRWWR